MNLQGGMEQTPKENCLTKMYVLACYHRHVACVFFQIFAFSLVSDGDGMLRPPLKYLNDSYDLLIFFCRLEDS